MSVTLLDEREPILVGLNFDSTNSPGTLPLFVADLLIRRIDNVVAINTDAIDHVIEVDVTDGATIFYEGSFTIPTLAGSAGNPAIDANPGTMLGIMGGTNIPAGWTIEMKCLVAVGAGKIVSITGYGGLL